MHYSVPSSITPSDDGAFRFEAELSEADAVNKNGRLYPLGILGPAIEEARPTLNARPGTVDHPDPDQPLSISDNGILWENIWFDGNRMLGRGKIIETAKGLDLKANIKAGVAVGFSTRGYGIFERRERDGKVFNEAVSYRYETTDAVVNPSSHNARIINFVGEAEEAQMDIEKLIQDLANERAATIVAKAAAEAAEASKAKDAERISALEAEVARLTGELTTANESIQTQATEIAQLQLEAAGDPALNRLNELTSDELFGEAIRAQVKATLEDTGVAPTVEGVEKLVARYRPLVEGLAAAGNNGAQPRGSVEDDVLEGTEEGKPSPEREQFLRDMGLL
jgi:hypothetical protein